MTRVEKILSLLQLHPGLTDREITNRIDGNKSPQQPSNIACRKLEKNGLIKRTFRDDDRIGNWLVGDQRISEVSQKTGPIKNNSGADQMSEDDAKKALVAWLENDGWTTKVAWGKARGVDIEADRNNEKWLIEVKGCGSRPEMRVNYFIGMLGELLQRMDRPDARYSIATPDIAQFRRLWDRLPKYAKSRLSLSMLLVKSDYSIEHLDL